MGRGLCAALRIVYFGAHEQRCLFHKLRNIYNAIRLPDTLTPQQRRRRRRAIFKAFCAIWQAHHYATALRRYLKVVRTYRQSQPDAVATLRRDFRLTVTYFDLEQQFPSWDRQHLRTISRLERFNRNIRRQARAANAYHSEQGVIAMATREAGLFHASQPHS
jgi:transposase-like protein